MDNKGNSKNKGSDTPDSDQPKSLRRSWKSSGPVAKTTAVFAGVAALATVVYAFASVWQLIELNKSTEISRESLESVQRAFLSFQNFEDARIQDPDHADVHNWSMAAVFQNNGATNAINVAGIAILAQLPTEPREDQFKSGYTELPTISIPPKSIRNVPVVPELIPEPLIFGIDLGETVTAAVTAKSNFNRQLFIWGWAYYRDVFPKTKPHVTEFCFRISGVNFLPDRPAPHIGFAYNGCKGHNCEDQQCKDYEEIVRMAETISD